MVLVRAYDVCVVTDDVLTSRTGQVVSEWWSWELVGRTLHIPLSVMKTYSNDLSCRQLVSRDDVSRIHH